MRIGIIQLCSGADPHTNLEKTLHLIEAAYQDGADIVATPEVTNCMTFARAFQDTVLQYEKDDITLKALRKSAKHHSKWLLIGSLALRSSCTQGRFINRSFLIDPNGEIRARYDKIHMFDVDLPNGERYRESYRYDAGNEAIVVRADHVLLGLSICYDLRFPMLYRDLAQKGAELIFVPSAFSVQTGEMHWHTLLRARAIETGAYIIAPAQSGTHQSDKNARQTYGHSLIVSPWGDVLSDQKSKIGWHCHSLDLTEVAKARSSIPSWNKDVNYKVIKI